MAFTVRRTSPLAPEQVWDAVTDVTRHLQHVPLTRAETDPGMPGPGWFFDLVTGAGPLAVRDRMLVTAWEPPRLMRVVKLGRPLDGWAEIRVRPVGTGSLLEWTESVGVRVPGLRRLSRAVGDVVAPSLFARVVDGLLDEAEAAHA